MSRIDAQMKIRVPEDLRFKIKKESDKSGRSMNAEIVHRLAQSFESRSGEELTDGEVKRLYAMIGDLMNKLDITDDRGKITDKEDGAKLE